MKSSDITYEEYRDNILEGVRHIGSKFDEPDDDWEPAFQVLTEKGLGIGHLPMKNMKEKDLVPTILKKIVQEFKPSMMSVVLSCWYKEIDAKGPAAKFEQEMMNQLGVRNAPGRKEMVMVHFYDKATATSEIWNADITRYEDKPPELGEFTLMEGFEKMEGRFGGLLEKAFEEDDA